MWDFSWIERRWPGAGYEDWPAVLDELLDRGYDAIRLDAFPHLVATAPEKEWTLLPVWQVHDWGSPAINRVRIQPGLHQFIGLCAERGIKVGLSSWYREDAEQTRLKIANAGIMAEQWVVTLEGLRRAGLLDTILYVDLCNEWPGDLWAPFFRNEPPELTWGGWHTEASMRWMRESCAAVRREFPELPIGYSFEPREPERLEGIDLGFADYAEPHLWMAQANDGEFYKLTGYKYDRFTFDSYNAVAAKGEATYRARPGYWQEVLRDRVRRVAAGLRPHRLPLMTTECWGVVDYRDWPLLDWNWVKELCEIGVETAAATGQWAAIATSNFAGPQFHGMWRDVAWHQRLNAQIRRAAVLPELHGSKLVRRLQGVGPTGSGDMSGSQ
ncbi:MAG: hypothetical protein QG602_3614 [Verrucomicrobiota bacterium]|nr:hypothetical protein [Verrucomicrobiota bacterium]